ncbi:hypothetical protein X772_25370 [Mesorhizobium sp. LSJC280B00]|nr:hypothetical protein X772_25370 [Mesorhizobium sp. LSJC280B00]
MLAITRTQSLRRHRRCFRDAELCANALAMAFSGDSRFDAAMADEHARVIAWARSKRARVPSKNL